MKIRIRNIAIAISSFAIFALSPEVRAIDDLCVTPVENSRMIRMEATAPNTSFFDIFLMDKRNRTIYHHIVDKGSCFKKVFDFTGLKDGTYTLVAEMKHMMRLNRVFEVKGNEVSLKESYYSFIPQFKIKDGSLLVKYINTDKEDIGITLTGVTGSAYSSFFDGKDLNFQKKFSFEDLTAGMYTLEFSSRGETFSYNFDIN